MRLSFPKITINRKSIGLVLATMVVTSGVAFAIFQSRSTITGNSISTANVDLLVSADGVNYSHTISGYDFEDILPTGHAAPLNGHSIYLKNAGRVPLSLSLAVDGPPSNPHNVDLMKFNFSLTDASGVTAPRGFILKLLVDGGLPIEGALAPGAVREYRLQALAADDAPLGVAISDINLAIVGTAHDPHQPPSEQ